ncbi:hypothetical protein [Altericroceibacterium spongiae]|uniref:hypothetical protein n=1 Tax=Altericroceibacterium spongiae TaxID=2320269 RepID=UPI001602210D|nr:hypothetical protein [Altericroceibacterium spongiae]
MRAYCSFKETDLTRENEQFRVRRDNNGPWRVCWSDYRPGRFTANNPPAFDIDIDNPTV